MRKRQKSKRNLKNFSGNQSGVAAMEFVLVFPILIALFMGCIELYGHFNAIRKLGNLTSSIADIVAQSRTISEKQLKALHPLAQTLMAPLDSTSISYSITNVRQKNIGQKPKLVWQQVHNASGISALNKGGNGACKNYTGAPGKSFPPNQDVIYVSMEFVYNSIFSELLGSSTTYSDNMLAVPRNTSSVKITGESGCN